MIHVSNAEDGRFFIDSFFRTLSTNKVVSELNFGMLEKVHFWKQQNTNSLSEWRTVHDQTELSELLIKTELLIKLANAAWHICSLESQAMKLSNSTWPPDSILQLDFLFDWRDLSFQPRHEGIKGNIFCVGRN